MMSMTSKDPEKIVRCRPDTGIMYVEERTDYLITFGRIYYLVFRVFAIVHLK
jgi:hypothetical protein